ncbi:hypothetical protein GGD70_004448 [Paraburkholderia fungorum]|nr:hypothetical protein [Paraburkholderia fungorum]
MTTIIMITTAMATAKSCIVTIEPARPLRLTQLFSRDARHG